MQAGVSSNCVFHKSEQLTNFCKTPSCWLPLCPECVKVHLQEHAAKGTPPEIDTISSVRGETLENLNELKLIHGDLAKRLVDLKTEVTSGDSEGLSHLQSACETLIGSIKSFFEELKSEYSRRLYEKGKIESRDIDSVSQQLQEKGVAIDGFMKKLESSGFVKYLVLTQTSNFFPNTFQAMHEIEGRLANIHRRTPEIRIDEAGLYSVKVDLARHIGIVEREFFDSFPSTPEKMPFMHPPPFINREMPSPPPNFFRGDIPRGRFVGQNEFVSPPHHPVPFQENRPIPPPPHPPRMEMSPGSPVVTHLSPLQQGPNYIAVQNHQPFRAPTRLGNEQNVYLREISPPNRQVLYKQNQDLSQERRNNISLVNSPNNKISSPTTKANNGFPQGVKLFSSPPYSSQIRSPLKVIGNQRNNNPQNAFVNNQFGFQPPLNQSLRTVSNNDGFGKVDRISLMKKSKNIFGETNQAPRNFRDDVNRLI